MVEVAAALAYILVANDLDRIRERTKNPLMIASIRL